MEVWQFCNVKKHGYLYSHDNHITSEFMNRQGYEKWGKGEREREKQGGLPWIFHQEEIKSGFVFFLTEVLFSLLFRGPSLTKMYSMIVSLCGVQEFLAPNDPLQYLDWEKSFFPPLVPFSFPPFLLPLFLSFSLFLFFFFLQLRRMIIMKGSWEEEFAQHRCILI